jgi:hypothetical protein
LDYGLHRGGRIMGRSAALNPSRLIHKLSGISPPKRLVFPKAYPQKSNVFRQKRAVFPGFSTIFRRLSTFRAGANRPIL